MDISKAYLEFAPGVYRYALVKLDQNKEDAEDVTSETFLRLMKTTEKVAEPKAWVFTIARNVIYEKYRDLNKTRRMSLDGNEYIEAELPDNFNTEDMAISDTLYSQIEGALKSLDDITREVIVLRVWEEMKFGQIADILHESEGTIKKRFYRGVEKLKELLVEKHDGKSISAISLPIIVAGLARLGTAQQFQAPANLLNLLASSTMTSTFPALVTGHTFTLPQIVGAVVATTAVVATGAAIALGVINNNNLANIQTTDSQAGTLSAGSTSTDAITLKDCQSNVFNLDGMPYALQYKVPSAWNCENSEIPSQGALTPDYFAVVESNDTLELDVTLSNLGRGDYCGAPASGSNCTTSAFYSGNGMLLNLQRDSRGGEIFGGYTYGWISIKYKNIATVDLAVEEKLTITNFLASIELVNLADETADWLTYRNGSVVLRYPSDWALDSSRMLTQGAEAASGFLFLAKSGYKIAINYPSGVYGGGPATCIFPDSNYGPVEGVSYYGFNNQLTMNSVNGAILRRPTTPESESSLNVWRVCSKQNSNDTFTLMLPFVQYEALNHNNSQMLMEMDKIVKYNF